MGTEEVPLLLHCLWNWRRFASGIGMVLYAFRNGYDYCDEEWGEH